MPLSITAAEKDKLLNCLEHSSKYLMDSTEGLSEAQWHFNPAPDSWSVSQVVEHLTVLEGVFVEYRWPQLMQAPAGEPGIDVEKMDAMILETVPDRTTKIRAPEMIAPTGRWAPPELLERFQANRRKTIGLISTADLREHVGPHPVLGPLDAYQWLLAVGAHTQRHTRQILEVKAHPEFPQA